MGHFVNVEIEIDNVSYTFQPYDRGTNGAFVYRLQGPTVHAPRVVVSTATNDNASDKMTVQLNHPRVSVSPESDVDRILGTDLVKTELRFLATTSQQDRALMIDQQIALLQEFRDLSETRAVLYS